MKKAWRIIITITLIVILLGAIFIGVGLITGADTERMFSVLDNRYNLQEWIDYILEVQDIVWSVFSSDAPVSSDALVMGVG